VSVVKWERQTATMAAVCAAAMLIAWGPEVASAAGKDDTTAPEIEAAPAPKSPLPEGLADWLERAARTYRADIADKLSAPRETGSNPDLPEGAQKQGFGDALRTAVSAALGYISFWLDRAYEAAGYSAPNILPFAAVGGTTHLAQLDAKQFVEARRKAEAEWKDAVERANTAAAEVAREGKRAGAAGGDSPAEAERKRAESRKLELEKIKQDLDRKIAEGLAKLEALDTANKARKLEEAQKARADEAARQAEEAAKAEKARAEEARKAVEAEAEQKAADEKLLAEAKAAEKKRIVDAEKSHADAARRVAAAEAARLAEAERKSAEEKYRAEVRKAEAQALVSEAAAKAAAIEREKKQAEAEMTRKAEEAEKAQKQSAAADKKRFAEASAADLKRLAEAARKAEEERKAAIEKYRADVKAAERQRVAAAEAETSRKEAEEKSVAEAREAEAKAADAKGPDERDAQAKAAEAKVAAAEPEIPVVRESEQRDRPDLRASRSGSKASGRQARRQIMDSRKGRAKKQQVRGYRIHVVRPGETLWSISQRFLKDGSRYAAIVDMNWKKIRDPDRIYPRQRLRVPRSRA
jgi:hypothetical protein